MNTTTKKLLRCATTLALVSSTACGDDTAKVDAAQSIDAAKQVDAAPQPKTFKQVEHLARPGINEALLITNDFLNGYNATAPTFSGVDPTTLNAVVGEAKTVLKALYLGVCYIDSQLPVDSTTEMKPAGHDCKNAVGTLIGSDGALTPEAGSAAQAYADAVFGQFEPDVMRIDTTITKSTYLSVCGGSAGPLLCGGRGLTDDVIDVTFDYLLAGAAVPLNGGNGSGLDALKQHLVSDGVGYNDTTHNLSALAFDPANSQQGHPSPTNTFPYSAAPL